jgi:hypothetical protein
MGIVHKLFAPRRGATVVIFEPRQKPEQEEHVYEVIEMRPYEEKEFEMPTATAAYRYEPLLSRDEAGERPSFPPDQEPRESTPDYSEEVRRGEEVAGQHEQLAKKLGLPTSAEEEETAQERARKKNRAKVQASAKKTKKATNGRRKKPYTVDDDTPEENEDEQIAAATNPMTSENPDLRGTTGKLPEDLKDAAGRKAGDSKPSGQDQGAGTGSKKK